MKKLNQAFILMPLFGSILSMSSILVSCKYNLGYSDNQIKKNEQLNATEAISEENISNANNIVDVANLAEINLFYSTYGVQTYNNMVRLAMLANSEVHFIKNTFLPFQNKLDTTYFTNFLRNDKKVDEDKNNKLIERLNKELDKLKTNNVDKNQIAKLEKEIKELKETPYKNSSVIEIGSFSNIVKAYNAFDHIIKNNLNKKINIWVNSDHFCDHPQFFNFLGYKNVTIHGLEDSEIMNHYYFEGDSGYKNEFLKYYNKSNGEINLVPSGYNKFNQYTASTKFKKVSIWWTDETYLPKWQEIGAKRMYLYDKKDKTKSVIQNKVFEARDKNNKRLFAHWPKIIGMNWETERDKVLEKQKNGKQSLIFLGDTRVSIEKDMLAYIIENYQDTYNIYYKGHPGHNDNNSFIESVINQGEEIGYKDLLTNELKKTQIKKGNEIIVLESQISSEELTTYHALETNGLHFDKFASSGFFSNALLGIENGYNTLDDLIFVYNKDKATSQETFYVKGITNNFNDVHNYWENLLMDQLIKNYIKITIKDEFASVEKNLLTANSFNITILDKSLEDGLSFRGYSLISEPPKKPISYNSTDFTVKFSIKGKYGTEKEVSKKIE